MLGRHTCIPTAKAAGSTRRGRITSPIPLLGRQPSFYAAYTHNIIHTPTDYSPSTRFFGDIRRNHSKSGSHLTHIDPRTGRARMVDVSNKYITHRSATAVGRIIIPEYAYKLVTDGIINDAPGKAPAMEADTPGPGNSFATDGPLTPNASALGPRGKPGKGDVLATAQLAGIMAAKRTSDLIPLCHPLPITHIEVVLEPSVIPVSSTAKTGATSYAINVHATVRTASRTGVEMEALTAANVALLTVWDMLKAVAGQEMMIERVCVSRKEGGASGLFERDGVI